MQLSTNNLVLAPDAPIDFQMHTVYSDGRWTPEQLLDYLSGEGFGLVAITDHERVDTAEAVQQLAIAKNMPVLIATELTTKWRNKPVDVLCFGFDPAHMGLRTMTENVLSKQKANTQMVYEKICQNAEAKSITDEEQAAFALLLEQPSAAQPPGLRRFLIQYNYATDNDQCFEMFIEAGGGYANTDIAEAVETVHAAGGVCLIAHPGRGNEYPLFDLELLEEIFKDAPLDGFEAYYPRHSAEHTALYIEYAERHNLLVSSGSDSHGPDKQFPIKYPAHLSRKLLERVGVQLSS